MYAQLTNNTIAQPNLGHVKVQAILKGKRVCPFHKPESYLIVLLYCLVNLCSKLFNSTKKT